MESKKKVQLEESLYSMRATRIVWTVESNASFVNRVMIAGANAMLGKHLSGGGFDASLENSLVVKVIGDGYVQCDFEVKKHHSNAFGMLHGGCTSLLVDVVGTMALLSVDPHKPGKVSPLVHSHWATSHHTTTKTNKTKKGCQWR